MTPQVDSMSMRKSLMAGPARQLALLASDEDLMKIVKAVCPEATGSDADERVKRLRQALRTM